MSSKKLDSIMKNIPAATVPREVEPFIVPVSSTSGNMTRLNAVVPVEVKIQIKRYLAEHPSETEKTLILKGLKLLGFHIPHEQMSDKRGQRS